MARRFNCCIFNHPIPIFCPLLRSCDQRQIVNPTFANGFGVFTNAGATVAAGTSVPLTFSQGYGTAISQSLTTPGAVELLAGSYIVNYSLNGTIPAGGTMTLSLWLNGAVVPNSTVSITGTAGQNTTLTGFAVVTLPQTGTLQLANTGAQAITAASANVIIRSL